MDWADDVTYAVHDLLDFFVAHLIPLQQLTSPSDRTERQRFFDEVFERRARVGQHEEYSRADLEQAFVELIPLLKFAEEYSGTAVQRAKLRLQTGILIARYMDAIVAQSPKSAADRRVMINPQHQKEVTMLKELTWHYVILNPALTTQQAGQRRIIRTLFMIFCRAAKDSNSHVLFPLSLRPELRTPEDTIPRIVSDYIAGMTERQALKLYLKLSGIAPGSGFQE